MKTIPPPCPEPETGRTYWRSLDQLADTPEFRQWAEREFPAGASEWTDPVSRRHFMRIMSASFLLAGFGLAGSGCRRPEEKILPFGKMPENYVHGVPEFYATAMPTRGSAIPLVAKATDGRPIKVEGNSSHPDSNGGTDRFAQASILNLYDPDRAQRFALNGNLTPRGKALDFLAGLGRDAQANGGQGLAFLLERNNSPSRLRLQNQLAQKLPQAKWYIYEPTDIDVPQLAAAQAFGKPVKPVFNFEAAKVVVSLDSDFLGNEQDVHRNIRGFTAGRKIESPRDSLNRLYCVESFYTITGFSAEHRLRLPSSAVIQVAAALTGEVTKELQGLPNVASLGTPAGVDPKWIAECANDLLHHRGSSLVVAGHRQPIAVHMLAYALNAALGNIGKTLVFHDAPEAKEGNIVELTKAINSGQVQTLVMLGGNPAYNAPADLDWAKAQQKVKALVRLAYYEDETSAIAPAGGATQWLLPATHYLESWGDAYTPDGTLVPIQPLIAPLFGGMTETEVLARIAGGNALTAYEVARETFAAIAGNAGGNLEERWKKYLFDGFLADSAAKPVEVQFNAAAATQAIATAKLGTPSRDKLEVVFVRDYKVDDGRYNNNGWLQELPDPITKMVWDNTVLISRKTARELNVKNGVIVEIKLGSRSIYGPIWVQPGFADYSLGLPLGYGRKGSGRVGKNVGFNAYELRTSDAPNFAVGATLVKTDQTYTMACTQDHWSLEGRAIIREVNFDQYRQHEDFAKRMKELQAEDPKPMYPNPFDDLKQTGVHQWGMAIDLNMCVGCSACMLACQSENNVPIVGKDQVRRGREMHWLRIDRYYAGDPKQHARFDTYNTDQSEQLDKWIDDPQAVTQPMLCQHCEAAPCENVCPVNATVHDQEGLNVMVYNRCVGTRYCSNNCPYKVRRFNFFDYNKRGFGRELYLGPLHSRKEDEWDLLKMSKNPDVTVRMRGVMEKCSYCIQRIEGAKIAQKVKAGASGDIVVPTDSFTTACAQACPSQAIVFGNIKDPESRVSKLKKNQRNYSVLEFLLTKPRTTYLAKVRNPNPAMPGFRADEGPMSFEEYKHKTGEDPLKERPEAEPRTPGAVSNATKGEH
jgi:MoCo/4Fe-4S cofactor protein with predicted Tat translocation signal